MNKEFLMTKIRKDEIGSGEQPCNSNKELNLVAKKNTNTIIWIKKFHISENSLCALASNHNIVRIYE